MPAIFSGAVIAKRYYTLKTPFLTKILRELAQGAQFARLGIGTEELDILPHRLFHLIVVRQRGAGWQAHLPQRPALGGAPFQPLLHHQAGGRLGDFFAQGCVHGSGGELKNLHCGAKP